MLAAMQWQALRHHMMNKYVVVPWSGLPPGDRGRETEVTEAEMTEKEKQTVCTL